MYYVLSDGRVTTDISILGDNEYIVLEEMPEYIIEKNNQPYLLSGVADGELLYELCSLEDEGQTEEQKSSYDTILDSLNKSQDEIRQEGANLLMEELIKRGAILK